MVTSTSAIVLSKIRYKDNDIIVKLFTKEYGAISFIVKGSQNSKKNKIKYVYFQELTILEIQFNYNLKRDLQYIKDIEIKHNYTSSHTDLVKVSVIMFLSEVLSNVITHQKRDIQLYNYIEESLIWYDINKSNTYFHMIFLIELTRYLGFYPDMLSNNFKYFNLEGGSYEKSKTSEYSITGDSLNLFNQILGIKFDSNPLPALNSKDKMEIINIILTYYKLHINNFKPIKSLEIVKNIFS
ncbi:MAG: DNA repair protein RecO [Flavobacteriales bacterium]|jgi:DNA repair protein RecO (recombination protein O)|nr:DNA repair protein RecO [Flavobacteriales bacterium]MDG2174246.1 DNA repair protein RecO [Flavobacteriaceae bacterium]|tara:strand:- start:2247 stop:2966 length:720 start_codon:yes stop_codon:yes gene_type:complete